jgi:hypothetical protein
MFGPADSIGERHFRRAVAEYVEHYHGERNHQGLDNRLISGPPIIQMTVVCDVGLGLADSRTDAITTSASRRPA